MIDPLCTRWLQNWKQWCMRELVALSLSHLSHSFSLTHSLLTHTRTHSHTHTHTRDFLTHNVSHPLFHDTSLVHFASHLIPMSPFGPCFLLTLPFLAYSHVFFSSMLCYSSAPHHLSCFLVLSFIHFHQALLSSRCLLALGFPARGERPPVVGYRSKLFQLLLYILCHNITRRRSHLKLTTGVLSRKGWMLLMCRGRTRGRPPSCSAAAVRARTPSSQKGGSFQSCACACLCACSALLASISAGQRILIIWKGWWVGKEKRFGSVCHAAAGMLLLLPATAGTAAAAAEAEGSLEV
jgi:hypothetical protein